MHKTEIGPWLQAPATISVPTFAIGDVHGRFDLLEAMHGEIAYLTGFDALSSGQIITLGDYVDRGPQGLAALALALDGTEIPGFVNKPLPGNHEQFLRRLFDGDVFERGIVLEDWLYNGAGFVAAELGMTEDDARADPLAFIQAIKDFLGPERLRRFYALPNHVRTGSYLFVHAGIHPRFGMNILDQDWATYGYQDDYDPLWIRGPFLTHEGPHDDNVIVVHGHTITDMPELRSNRIGLDTGAYRSGRLSAVELLDDKLRFIQVSIDAPRDLSALLQAKSQDHLSTEG